MFSQDNLDMQGYNLSHWWNTWASLNFLSVQLHEEQYFHIGLSEVDLVLFIYKKHDSLQIPSPWSKMYIQYTRYLKWALKFLCPVL